jgi:D-glycero-D-manno-heptose 1,7-bisphosphate phosphatase
MRKAVFIVKDGALLVPMPGNVEASLMRMMPFAVDALKRLQGAGYSIVVMSEQPEVAHGVTETQIDRMRQYLEALLMMFNVRINGFYYCPHDPKGTVNAYTRACECRTPAPGLLLRAAAEHQIDLRSSWVIGTTAEELEAAARAGCRAVLYDQDADDYDDFEFEDEIAEESNIVIGYQPEYIAADLNSAAEYIISSQQQIPEDLFAKAS